MGVAEHRLPDVPVEVRGDRSLYDDGDEIRGEGFGGEDGEVREHGGGELGVGGEDAEVELLARELLPEGLDRRGGEEGVGKGGVVEGKRLRRRGALTVRLRV